MTAPARDTGRDWMADAACRDHDPELFFPISKASQAAIRICRACPIKKRCEDYAIAHREQHGIWGGMHADERHRARRRVSA